MQEHNNGDNSSNSLKSNNHATQLQTIFAYLEKKGRLWELQKTTCKHTGFKAWYLTTNPDFAPIKPQLKLF